MLQKEHQQRHVTAVIPYFGWARQDRKRQTKGFNWAKLVANLLQTAVLLV